MAERTCILSGKALPRERLIRFVAGPDGFAVADLAEKLPGRGAWIEVDAEVIRRADDKGVLQRRVGAGLRDVEADIERITMMMHGRALATAGLARRAGCLIGGAGKLAAATEDFAGLFAAPDASERELRRLSSRLGVEWTTRLFSAEELGGIFGRDSLAFVGLQAGRSKKLAESLRREIDRLEAFSASSACQAG